MAFNPLIMLDRRSIFQKLTRNMKSYFAPLLLSLMTSLSTQAQDLSELFERVNPGVVVIFTEESQLVGEGERTRKVSQGGLGSGFMISDKQIITAAHVVQVAEDVKVQFHDDEVIPAKVLSTFKAPDVALLELMWPRKNPTILNLGDSDDLRIGERIFVVGAPFGLFHSLSSGFVSGITASDSQNPFSYTEFIQTDAAINTGNSGGPMFNMKGEVVGVVSFILSQSGGFNGIGFAATSNVCKDVLIDRSIFWAGADSFMLRGKLAKAFNLPQSEGLLIQRVVLLSPLGLLGLRGGEIEATIGDQKVILGGDIVLAVNGIQLRSDDDTLNRLAQVMDANMSSKIVVTVLRNGKVIELRSQ